MIQQTFFCFLEFTTIEKMLNRFNFISIIFLSSSIIIDCAALTERLNENSSLFSVVYTQFSHLYSTKNNKLTCFTCDISNTNQKCNSQAIDEPCNQQNIGEEEKKQSCMTIHRFNSKTKQTLSVEKQCTTECTPHTVGCKSSDSQNIQVIFHYYFYIIIQKS
jgi:hypothetical protein